MPSSLEAPRRNFVEKRTSRPPTSFSVRRQWFEIRRSPRSVPFRREEAVPASSSSEAPPRNSVEKRTTRPAVPKQRPSPPKFGRWSWNSTTEEPKRRPPPDRLDPKRSKAVAEDRKKTLPPPKMHSERTISLDSARSKAVAEKPKRRPSPPTFNSEPSFLQSATVEEKRSRHHYRPTKRSQTRWPTTLLASD